MPDTSPQGSLKLSSRMSIGLGVPRLTTTNLGPFNHLLFLVACQATLSLLLNSWVSHPPGPSRRACVLPKLLALPAKLRALAAQPCRRPYPDLGTDPGQAHAR